MLLSYAHSVSVFCSSLSMFVKRHRSSPPPIGNSIWSTLLLDLLRCLSTFIHLKDWARLQCVSRHWRAGMLAPMPSKSLDVSSVPGMSLSSLQALINRAGVSWHSLHLCTLDSPLLRDLADCLRAPIKTLSLSAHHQSFSEFLLNHTLSLFAQAGIVHQILIRSSSPRALRLAALRAPLLGLDDHKLTLAIVTTCQHCDEAIDQPRIVCLCEYYTCGECLLARCSFCGQGVCNACEWLTENCNCDNCGASTCGICLSKCFGGCGAELCDDCDYCCACAPESV